MSVACLQAEPGTDESWTFVYWLSRLAGERGASGVLLSATDKR